LDDLSESQERAIIAEGIEVEHEKAGEAGKEGTPSQEPEATKADV
jgi:hypothetical protein